MILEEKGERGRREDGGTYTDKRNDARDKVLSRDKDNEIQQLR